MYDELTLSVSELQKAIDGFTALTQKADELEKYYSGKLWKKDYSDDEAGLLPQELKRGVLSEDGLYNLLDEVRSLKELIGK